MSVKLIELAKQRIVDAERRLQEVREEEESIAREIAEWQDFVQKAESLTISVESESDAPLSANGHKPSMVKLKQDSLAGLSAKLILEQGPLSLKSLAERLEAMGHGKGIKDFSTALNTALWRRKHDVFEKREKNYHLRTEEIEFVD